MSEDSRWGCDLDLAVEQVKVRATHAAGMHAQQQLSLTGAGDRALDRAQRLADSLEDHRSHHPKNSSAVSYSPGSSSFGSRSASSRPTSTISVPRTPTITPDRPPGATH